MMTDATHSGYEVGEYVSVKGDPYQDKLRVVRVDRDAWGAQVLTVQEGKPCEDGATYRVGAWMVERSNG